jgi:hypothetical protein
MMQLRMTVHEGDLGVFEASISHPQLPETPELREMFEEMARRVMSHAREDQVTAGSYEVEFHVQDKRVVQRTGLTKVQWRHIEDTMFDCLKKMRDKPTSIDQIIKGR